MLIFTWFYWKKRFRLFSGKVTLFSALCFWELTFPFFVPKLHSWRFTLPKTCFWFSCSQIGSFRLYVTKSSDLVFREKTSFFKFHRKENMLLLVVSIISLRTTWANFAAFSFLRTALYFIRTRTALLTLYLTDNMFCFMQGTYATKLGSFELYLTQHKVFTLLLLSPIFPRTTLFWTWTTVAQAL